MVRNGAGGSLRGSIAIMWGFIEQVDAATAIGVAGLVLAMISVGVSVRARSNSRDARIQANAAQHAADAAKAIAEATKRLASTNEEQTAILRAEQERLRDEQDRLREREEPRVEVEIVHCWPITRQPGQSCTIGLQAMIENLSVNRETLRSAELEFRSTVYKLPPSPNVLEAFSRERPDLRLPFVLEPRLPTVLDFSFVSSPFEPPDD